MRLLKYLSILLVIFILTEWLIKYRPQYQEYNGFIFNTYYHIKIFTHISDKDLDSKIISTLEDVNNKMSIFNPKSEISLLNRYPAFKEFKLSDDLSYILKNSEKINYQSSGYFDPTIAPLIDLWGFGRNKTNTTIPTTKQIRNTLKYSKFSNLKFSKDYSTVTKSDSRIEINLSAIAKGFAVDKLSSLLKDEGYKNYIIDIGGEVRATGKRDRTGSGWNIGLSTPDEQSKNNALILELSDLSVATSGDYRNFKEHNGQRFSHTISPLTGEAKPNQLASVTVFSPSCMLADAYATAIMAMGKDLGVEFAENNNLPVIFFIHSSNNDFGIKYSSAAQELLGVKNEANQSLWKNH